MSIKSQSIKFMIAQCVAYFLGFLCLYFSFPFYLTSIAMFLTLLIPFMWVVMILTDNPLYERSKEKKWLGSGLAVVITVYGAISYVWASGVINSIFEVSPTNLPWSTTILTVVYFFKNVVLWFSIGVLCLLLAYCNLWVWKVLFSEYEGAGNFLKKVGTGVAFVFGVGLVMGTAGVVTAKKDDFAKIVALKADFNTSYRCHGPIFEQSSHVLFLPNGKVLVAKRYRDGAMLNWRFVEAECQS